MQTEPLFALKNSAVVLSSFLCWNYNFNRRVATVFSALHLQKQRMLCEGWI